MKKNAGISVNILLIVFGTLFALLLAEIGYRAYAIVNLSRPDPGSSKASLAFDNTTHLDHSPEFGYSYRPNDTWHFMRVQEGKVSVCSEEGFLITNALALPGQPPTSKEEAEFTIQVFGDSFTAWTRNGLSWTNLLERKLTQRLKKKVRIVNHAMHAYGVVNMVDKAAVKAQEEKTDLVIFAFILHDLIRKRFWIAEGDIDGVISQGQQFLNSSSIDYNSYGPLYIVEPKATIEWCRKQLTSPNPDDPILNKLIADRNTLSREIFAKRFLGNFRESYLYNRIKRGNPLLTTPTLTDYSKDEKFVTSMDSILATKVPFLFLRLPTGRQAHEQALHYDFANEKKLLKSLKQLSDNALYDIEAVFDLSKISDDVEFLSPDDGHPSPYAQEYYAENIANFIMNIIMDSSHEKKTPGGDKI